MRNLFLLTSNELFTDKAKSLVSLFKTGVNVPATLIFQNEYEINRIIEILTKLNAEYFYIRINFPDNTYPHHLSAVHFKETIETNLALMIKKSLELKKNRFDVIIQPILNFEWSGVALVKNSMVFVELVLGHPISLLRLGQFKYRFLFDSNFNILDHNEGNQSIFMSWEKDKLKEDSSFMADFAKDQILKSLCDIRTENTLLYEIGFRDKEIFYLEHKSINPDSYIGINRGKIEKPFLVYHKRDRKLTEVYLLNPNLKNITIVTPKNNIKIEEGAYLSHLATYSAINKINCSFFS